MVEKEKLPSDVQVNPESVQTTHRRKIPHKLLKTTI